MEWMLSQKEDKVTAVMKRKKTLESQVKFVKKKKDWKRKRTKVSHRRKRKQCVKVLQNCAQMILYHQNNRPKLWSKIRNKIRKQKLKKRKRKQKKRQKKRKKKLKD
jgi:hypothetical protein